MVDLNENLNRVRDTMKGKLPEGADQMPGPAGSFARMSNAVCVAFAEALAHEFDLGVKQEELFAAFPGVVGAFTAMIVANSCKPDKLVEGCMLILESALPQAIHCAYNGEKHAIEIVGSKLHG